MTDWKAVAAEMRALLAPHKSDAALDAIVARWTTPPVHEHDFRVMAAPYDHTALCAGCGQSRCAAVPRR